MMGSLCTFPFQATKVQWCGERNGSLSFLGYKLQHNKMGIHSCKKHLACMYVCMYVCMYDKVLLEKSTFKNDFYFSYFLLTYNSIAPLYLCINHLTYIYLLNNHLLFYLPTYLSTYKTYPIKAKPTMNISHLR